MDLIAPQRETWTPPRAEVRLHNHFLAEVRDARTGRLVQKAEAENVVLNQGRAYIAGRTAPNITSMMNAIAVGSGSAAPAPTDTTLSIFRAKAFALSSGSPQVGDYQEFLADETNGVWWHRYKYQFAETEANFDLTEVGLEGYQGPLVTRALLRDANGNPISVTKTSSQILTITATVYMSRGGVDSGMRLLNSFFSRSVQGQFTANNVAWLVGTGTTPPTDADTTLAGTSLGEKAGGALNSLWWDGAAWVTQRPANKEYATSMYVDWNLNEALGDISEAVVIIGQTYQPTFSVVRLVFPCGNVAGTSYTKTNQVKLRQYLELLWG